MRILLTLIGPALLALAFFLALIGGMYVYQDMKREAQARDLFRTLREGRKHGN